MSRVHEDFHVQQLPNGLTLITQQMPWLQTAAFTILVPAGCAYEEARFAGLASATSEMTMRGAGRRDSRQLIIDLDLLGIDHGGALTHAHAEYRAATRAENLPRAMEIFADIIRRPILPAEELEAVRSSALRELSAIEDDPPTKLKHHWRRRAFGPPWNRRPIGTRRGICAIDIECVRRFHRDYYQPVGTIIAVVGPQPCRALSELVNEHWGDWTGENKKVLPSERLKLGTVAHVGHCSEQTHIAVSWPSVAYGHPQAPAAAVAVDVLGGGLSCRLFTELRERSGLCYTTYATVISLRTCGVVYAYTAATAEFAAEALGAMIREIRRLPRGVSDDELNRSKARAKAGLLMRFESASAVSADLAYQWFLRGHIRTTAELRTEIERIDARTILRHLADHPPQPLTIVTLGPCPVEIADAIP